METTPNSQPKTPYRLVEDPLLIAAAEKDERLATHLENLRQTEAVLATRQKNAPDSEIPASLREVRDVAEEETWRYLGEVGYATSEPPLDESTST